jgi:lipopolysaccharide export system permease protein
LLHRIIDRYILREITLPFFLILGVLTFVLLMGKLLQLMDMMVNKGVGLLDISRLVLFLLPSFFVFTIPIALLMAILIGLGRLSADNEWIALRASGVSLYQLVFPIAVATLAAFLFTALINLFLVPYSTRTSKDILYGIAKQKASIGIKEGIFNDDFEGLVLYAENIPLDGAFMEGVIISDRRTVQEPTIIIARKAYLVSDPHSLVVTLRLENGSIHSASTDFKSYRKAEFRSYDLNLDMGSSLSGGNKTRRRDASEMTLGEIVTMLQSATVDKKTSLEMIIEMHRKLSIPLSCIIFALLGMPLGIRAHRAVRARGFTIGLIVVLAYYLLQLGGTAMAETGRLPPFLGAWIPNGIFFIAGAYTFISAAREKPLRIPSLLRFTHSGRRD